MPDAREKMHLAGLDELDRSLIELLGKDARASNRQLGRALGVSEGTIRNRLKKLLDGGRFQIIVYRNPNRPDHRWRSFVGIKALAGELDQLVTELTSHPSIRYIALAAGRFDIVLLTEFETRHEMVVFMREYLAALPGIQESDTHVVLAVVKSLGTLLEASLGVPRATELE